MNIQKKILLNINNKINTKENKTELNKTELNKTELNKTELNKTELNKTELNKTELNKTELIKTEINNTNKIKFDNNVIKYNNLKYNINSQLPKKNTNNNENIIQKNIGKIENINNSINRKLLLNKSKKIENEKKDSINNNVINIQRNIESKTQNKITHNPIINNINKTNIKKFINNNKIDENLNKPKKIINSNLYVENLVNLEENDKKFTAIIVEPRIHRALEYILNNFVNNLDNLWRFVIYHSEFNEKFVLNIVNILKRKNSELCIDMIKITKFNLHIRDYSHLLSMREFYEIIPTEIILIFQTDSIILSKNKNLINDFLEYDYVGAPWKDGKIGNGGLSLRRKSKMIEIIEKIPYTFEPEDVYFCHRTRGKVDINYPDFNKAKQFSIEACYTHIAFGVHQVWKTLNKNEYENLIKLYPEVKLLQKLQSF